MQFFTLLSFPPVPLVNSLPPSSPDSLGGSSFSDSKPCCHHRVTDRPEILIVRHQKLECTDINENIRDTHGAFPGGRSEPGHEGSLLHQYAISLPPALVFAYTYFPFT